VTVATHVTQPRGDEVAIVDGLLADIGRIPPSIPSDNGDDGERPWREPERTPLVANAVLGMVMFLGAEVMFFAALVGAFFVLRLGAQVWPPPLQPRLPVEVTGVNTVILLLSGAMMALALRAIGRGNQAGLRRYLGCTAVLGAVFLAVQGYEWTRLVHFGLTASSGIYGATFYTLVGVHGAHVLGALIWLSLVALTVRRGRFGTRTHVPVTLCGMFWFFVVFVWPVLYVLVYLR
jgi:cytochrome c oxidase subunit III